MNRSFLPRFKPPRALHYGPLSRSFLLLLLAAVATHFVRATPTRSPVPGPAAPAKSESKSVKVTTRSEGGSTTFYVDNQELCEITMTFEFDVRNLKSSVPLPYTATFPAGQVTEAFSLSPDKAGEKWEYSYTNYFKLGGNCCTHDDNYAYQLPYDGRRKYKVTQASNGSYSHKGSNRHAIDWKMPEGTSVLAARGGLVIKVKDDSDTGGPSMKFDGFNNFVLVRHEDGTLGHYCHLNKDSVLVKAGEKIQAGQRIARSGNTGFSSGPHLHFCVFVTKSGRTRESVPIKFKTEKSPGESLSAGRSYRAPVVQNAGIAGKQPGSAMVSAQ